MVTCDKALQIAPSHDTLRENGNVMPEVTH